MDQKRRKKKKSMVRQSHAPHLDEYPMTYPWDLWFERASRKSISLRRGMDYLCQPHSMSVMTRGAAARRGLLVSVGIQGDTLTISVRGRKEEDQ